MAQQNSSTLFCCLFLFPSHNHVTSADEKLPKVHLLKENVFNFCISVGKVLNDSDATYC